MSQADDLPVTYRGSVAEWHCDHMGHMNVMHYVGKFDEATWNLFHLIGISQRYVDETGMGMAAVQQNIAYKRELLAGEVIFVRTRLIEIRERVIRFVHDMVHTETGGVAARCELTGVHLDRTARKAVPFPPAVRATGEAMAAAHAEIADD
jgi:acyl-CoA thioester hydrolase